ncbi:MAG: glycine cleavage system aminomethyltransferase GcvT [Bacteroidota bacterium]
MKKTPLYDTHKALGAKLIPFAGYDMPVRYTGDKEEHMAVRQHAGLFDVSHMGEFFIRGPKALELIQKVTSNDASKLVPGKAQYSCLPNHEGGIVDDLIVYKLAEEEYMLVVNASNIEKDWDWIQASNDIGAQMDNESEDWALLAVSGPKAEAVVQELTTQDMSQMKTYTFWVGPFFNSRKAIIATTGYTGERTFECFVPTSDAEATWKALLDVGETHNLIPTGLGARDTLRLEMGYMLYGNDITDDTSPLEAGLGWITKFKKGPFNGSAIIQKQKETGIGRKLVSFELLERGIPRKDYPILVNGEEVGKVTSGSLSPVLNKGIGLGYVPVALSTLGQEIEIGVRRKNLPAKIVKAPFIR